MLKIQTMRIIELLLLLAFLMVGGVGLVAGRAYLANFLPDAAFVVLLNLIIGIKVGAGMSVVCLVILGEPQV